MSTRLLVVILMFAFTIPGIAEARWCSVATTKGNQILYPPIARAASVSGVVIGRIDFKTSGEVTRWLPISGPKLLSEPMGAQLKHWTIATDAQGGQPCQALVIGEFLVGDTPQITKIFPVGVLGVVVRAEKLILYTISDPSPKIIKSSKLKFWRRR